jgi:hypothetical protein
MADILAAGLPPLRRAGIVAAKDEPFIGVATCARSVPQVLQTDGNGEIGPERQPLAGRSLGDEHPSADVLARRLEERVGRMQHRQLDPFRPGALEKDAEGVAGRSRDGDHGPAYSAASIQFVIPVWPKARTGTHEHRKVRNELRGFAP